MRLKEATNLNFKLSDLNKIGCLGVGSFSRVTLVEHVIDGKMYALKKMKKKDVVDQKIQKHILNERKILALSDNPFCVKFYGTLKDEMSVYLLMEPVMGGELFSLLHRVKGCNSPAAAFYAGNVVLALDYLHNSLNVIYRDVIPENLMICPNGYLKLVDFSFAKKRDNSNTLCGTPQYLAPEVIRNHAQGFGVDWWTLGILIYEMTFGRVPFESDESMKMYEKILTAPVEFPGTPSISACTRNIINSLLRKAPHKRLGVGSGGTESVKMNEFFEWINWEQLQAQRIDPPWKPELEDTYDMSAFNTYSDSDDDEEEKEDLMDDLTEEVFKWCDEF